MVKLVRRLKRNETGAAMGEYALVVDGVGSFRCRVLWVSLRKEKGAALVEFTLVSLALYLLLAGTIEFGRLMFAANAVQDAARVAARELSVAPINANVTFDHALTCDP